jgi:4-amino-4-deoxy-L-arabinose transferase-like glycosyltransferase
MSQTARHQLSILIAAGLIFFTCLGTAALWDEDETWYASCAREMIERGDWVVPMFNGHVFPEKPPLMFWTMIAGFKLFGETELAARFFSAVFGVATALVTYHLGRRLFSDRVAFLGGVITASSIIFTVSARAATVDAALVLLTTAAVWCFVMLRGEWNGERRENESQGVAQFAICNLQLPICNTSVKQFALFLSFYLLLGLAVLAKGPIGYLLPMTALGLFLMIKNFPPRKTAGGLGLFDWPRRIVVSFFKSLWQLRPITGLVVTLAVAMPWYVLVADRTQGQWVQTFIFDFCVRPFTQPILGHSGPFWYYLPAVLIGFFPWSVFLGPTCIDLYRRLRAGIQQSSAGIPHSSRGILPLSAKTRQDAAATLSNRADPRRDGLILLACLFSVWFVFWSICSTKLPHYLLPVYPALALLTANFLDAWIAEQTTVRAGWMRAAFSTAIFVGLGMTVALPIVAWLLFPGEEWIGAIGPILMLGGWLGLRFNARGDRLRAVQCYAACSVAFLTAAFGFVAIGIDRHQNARPMMAAIHRDCPDAPAICEYAFHRKSSVYYAGRPIALCDNPAALGKFLDSVDYPYIITLAERQADIEKSRPGEFEVLLRQPRFATVARPIAAFRARPSELIVLKRAASAVARAGAKSDR